MKLALNDFRQAMGLMAGVVDRRVSIPILSNVSISGSGVGTAIRGTDLDMELIATVPGEGDAVSTTVDARRLAAWASRIDGESVTLVPAEGGRLRFEADDAYADMATLPIDDYPVMRGPDAGYGPEIEFDPAALAADLRFCQPAISTEETRYYLNGIHIDVVGDDWKMVATDGHRLNLTTVRQKPAIPKVIIPRKAVALMLRLIAASPGENRAALAFTPARMRMVCGRYTLITKLIDGTFPDYTRVIPADETARAFVKMTGRELERSARAAMAIGSDRWRPVKMTNGSGHTLKLSTTCPDTGEASARCRGSTADGLTFPIGFNGAYLATVGRMFGAAALSGRFSDAAGPALWTSEDAPGRLVVLMPMRC